MLFTYSSSSSSSVTGSSRTTTQPCSGTLRHIDALLDDALRLSLRGLHEIDAFRDRLPVYLKSAGTPPSAAPLEQIAATARARLCQSLQGRTIHLVGPHETLYQLHTYLLKALHPPTVRVSCPGPLSCSFHAPCHPLSSPLGILRLGHSPRPTWRRQTPACYASYILALCTHRRCATTRASACRLWIRVPMCASSIHAG